MGYGNNNDWFEKQDPNVPISAEKRVNEMSPIEQKMFYIFLGSVVFMFIVLGITLTAVAVRWLWSL